MVLVALPAREALDAVDASVTPEDAPALVDGSDGVAPSALETTTSERSAAETAEVATGLSEDDVVEDGPACRILGRVVDTSGRPIPEVTVWLHASCDWWSEGVRGSDFSCETDEDGRFEVRTPLPTCDWTSANLMPSLYYTREGRDFGLAGGWNRDPLVEGDNDLGTITLRDTGAISGIVRGPDGVPLVGAEVSVEDSPGEYTLIGESDESGRYVVGHVVPGTYELRASADGFLIAKLGGVEVDSRVTSEGHDFVLEAAPFITGTVLDAVGVPIEGVHVQGSPASGSGMTAGGWTGADGGFRLDLPQDEPHRLRAKKTGYISFGEPPNRSKVYPQGTTDVTIHLVPENQVTLHVVDARTGDPVERFGLEIGEEPGRFTRSREELPVELHVGGGLSVSFSPLRPTYRIQAPGYAPQCSALVSPWTIRLEPEGRMRGRVLFEGAPVPNATVRIARGWLASQPDSAEFQDDDWRTTHDLDDYTGRLRILASDDDGRFDLGELASGTYEVVLSAAVGAPRTERSLHVVAGEVLDLGDLELRSGATVHGRVVATAGIVTSGLTVLLESPTADDRARVTVGGDGQFELAGLAAGEHGLLIEDTPGVVLGMEREPLVFEVDEGETLDLVLDLRPWQPALGVVRVVDAGAPLEGASISTRYERDRRSITPRPHITDADGTARIEVPGGAKVRFEVGSPLGFALAAMQVEPDAGEEVAVELGVEAGELNVVFPGDFTPPEEGVIRLELRAESDPRALYGSLSIAAPSSPESADLRWSGSRYALGRVSSGAYEVKGIVRVLGPTDFGFDAWRQEGDPFVGRVEVVGGGSVTAVLSRP